MIPLWAISGLAAAVIAGFAGWQYGTSVEGRKLERERAAWANERSKAAELHADALASEIRAHNVTRNALEVDRENAETRRTVAEQAAQAADDRASAAGLSERRLRDAVATHRVATGAALETARATSVCAPATQAADLYADLLGRYRDSARRIGDAGRAIGRFADAESAAASECADRASTMIRNSGQAGAE